MRYTHLKVYTKTPNFPLLVALPIQVSTTVARLTSPTLSIIRFFFFTVARLMGKKWYFIMVLIYISKITTEIEFLLINSSASPLWKTAFLYLLPDFLFSYELLTDFGFSLMDIIIC